MNDLPKPGEYWTRADGSTDGVTVVSVGSGNDPWITYRYDSGMISEKNLLAFRCRFYLDAITHKT